MTRLTRSALLCSALALLPQLASAQAALSTEEILARLKSQRELQAAQPVETGGTRGLKLVAAAKPAEKAAAETAEAPAAAKPARQQPARKSSARVAPRELPVLPDDLAIDLVVFFEFGSARLKPEARTQLDALCAAVRADAGPGTYQVIGHTDATGAADINLDLSQARAETVVDYMVTSCGIPAARLQAHGLGEERLRDTLHPRAAANRRVEIQVAG